MLRLNDYITEAFNSPYKYSKRQAYKGSIVYSFTTSDKSVVDVIFKENEISDDESVWSVSFEKNFDTRATGEGDAMRIFSTVIDVIKDFAKKEKPQEMTFSAEKPAWRMNLHHKDPKRSKDMGSREKLYKRLVQRYAGRMGYKYSIRSDHSASDFSLKRK